MGFTNRVRGKELITKDSVTPFGTSGALFKGGGNLYVNSNSPGLGNTSDTTEDTLDTYTLPGNALLGNNYMLTLNAFGTFAANTHSKAAKLYFGSQVVSITGYATSITGGTPWFLSMSIMKIGASLQSINGQTITGSTHNGSTVLFGTETDTASIVVKVTGTTGTAAANDVALAGWFVEANNF